ncbi:hypothetical protein UUU_44270 [Klebsiella pneumoniae subsp. pneumoniae DSM 30104 = JCM 1662 = NBRC 14940]|nr:hypothetical protein UUU_44270 [Klebsiella pneumoniae subsp. pneumoniae DSM 30104 = JCM 1662 = NBRC 14940]
MRKWQIKYQASEEITQNMYANSPGCSGISELTGIMPT